MEAENPVKTLHQRTLPTYPGLPKQPKSEKLGEFRKTVELILGKEIE